MANINQCDCCGTTTSHVWTALKLSTEIVGLEPDPDARPISKHLCDKCTADCDAAMRVVALGRTKHPELGTVFAIMLRTADAYIVEKTPKQPADEEVFVPGGIFEGGIAGRVTVAEVDGESEEPDKGTNGHTPFLSNESARTTLGAL